MAPLYRIVTGTASWSEVGCDAWVVRSSSVVHAGRPLIRSEESCPVPNKGLGRAEHETAETQVPRHTSPAATMWPVRPTHGP
jgi:hypothetical protein